MNDKILEEHYDKVIDGYNALWFHNVFEQKRQENDRNYIFMILNIKNFRYYNAVYGIDAGNEILKLVYDSLVRYIQEDEYVARRYADTFVLLLKYDGVEENIQNRLTELFGEIIYRIDDERIYRNLFISAGVYDMNTYTDAYEIAYNLTNIVRLQCDGIKKRVHCYEFYSEELSQIYLGSCDLEVKTAEAYKNYEFTTYLQPKVDAKTHEIIGAEALLRWFDKEGNEIPLYKFLPILTQNTYITLVDLDVFELGCKMLHERIKEGKRIVPISFNICKPNFYDPDLIRNYMEIFNRYEIPKEFIQFELMESITLNDMDKMKEVVHQFKEEGFSCSLDDFGSGYSSFNVLLNAEISEVKLDRQFFLKNLNGDNKKIISTVIQLIKSLHMNIIAEGVETKEYADFLAEQGCDSIQGYYFHKPMPEKEFTTLLDKKSDT